MNKATRRLCTRIGGAALLVGGCYLLYTFGLSDKAKQDVKNAAQSVKEAYEKISDAVLAAQGQVMEDDGPLPNVQSTISQWESIGY